jgi:4-hydroxy-tetrahydrodipicolinate reductase
MERIKVMIAGFKGKMATLIAEHVENAENMKLEGFALSEDAGSLQIGKTEIFLITPDWHENRLRDISPDIIVDFTLPRSVNRNAELYCRCGIPFVMGTTGGDRELLKKTVEQSDISAVIAPNMAKQIVGFQAMMEYAARTFPNLFAGYSLEIRESHQKGKPDTSATAIAMVGHFVGLGIPFSRDRIIMERDPDVQKDSLGVPERSLLGHAWHTYRLISPDGTVKFEFTHNVNGRDVYALGTLDAITFLNKKAGEGVKGKVFTMIDVLKG